MRASYDNALAETINGLYKTELVRRQGPRRDVEAVEFATLRWVDWFNHRRLLGSIGDIPPAEFEQLHSVRQGYRASNEFERFQRDLGCAGVSSLGPQGMACEDAL